MDPIQEKQIDLVICITGTPGVGKTTVSKKLASLLGGEVIDVGSLILDKKLFFRYDRYRDTFIVDEGLLKDLIKTMLEKGKNHRIPRIIDTHLVGLLRDLNIDHVFVLTCDPLLLFNRIVNKKVAIRKAVENVASEFLNQILAQTYENFDENKITIIDTSCKSVDEVAAEIANKIRSENSIVKERTWRQVNWSFRATWISKLLSSFYDKTSGQVTSES